MLPTKLKVEGGGEGEKEETTLSVTAEGVKLFLGENPHFLRENPEVLWSQLHTERRLGRNVIDFQEVLIKYLRHEIGCVEAMQEEVLETARVNMVRQQTVYDCVQSLLQARSFENVVEIINTDFQVHLGLTSVVLCMEADEDDLHMLRDVRILPRGMVDLILGGRDVVLRDHIFGEGEIFGRVAALIRSDALLRLRIQGREGGVMLAFGSDKEDCFGSDQSVVLIEFFGTCVEQFLDIWIERMK